MGNCWIAPPKAGYSRDRRRVTGYHSTAHSGLRSCQDSSGKGSFGGDLVLFRAHSAQRRTRRVSSPALTVCTSDEGSGPLPFPRYDGELLSSPHLKPFSLVELKNATNNFHPDNLLREEEYGYVFKGSLDEQSLDGTVLSPGTVVSVKKLKPGTQNNKEWLSQVTYLGQLRHPNLLKYVGYCLQSDNRLLVHEFMPRETLQIYLFEKNEPLSWEARLKIAIGAARGISFLQNSDAPVIFREFKASRILLDLDFNAKLFDFGLAAEGSSNEYTSQSYANSPDYANTDWLNSKWVVYRFGVVLLELLSGQKADDETKVGVERNLVEWVKFQVKDQRRFHRVMDSKLAGQYPRHGAWMAVALALQCLSNNAKLRPSMDEVLASLEEIGSRKSVFIDTSQLQALPIPPPRSPSRTSLDQLSPLSLTPSGTPCLSPIRSPR